MSDAPDDFDALRRLLSLKNHEAPPPGFFDRMPGQIMARIQEPQPRWTWETLMDRLFQIPWFQPVASASMALLVGGLFFAALSNPADSSLAPRSATFSAPTLGSMDTLAFEIPASSSIRSSSDSANGLMQPSLQPLTHGPIVLRTSAPIR